MQPDTTHSFLMPSRDTVLDLKWIHPRRTFGERLRMALRHALFGGPDPDSPAHLVSVAAFDRAYGLLERGDVDAATAAFAVLGYDVSVHALPVPAGSR